MASQRDSGTEGLGLPGAQDSVSREEIRQRINTLYNRAESDTGTFNATRAMSRATRRSTGPGRDGGRPGELQADAGGLEAVARQWFDVARSRLGPTVPASLPTDRTPDRPAAAVRPARTAERPAELPSRLALEAPARRVPELAAGTGKAIAALPAAPESPRNALPALPAAPTPSADAPRSALKTSKGQIQRKLSAARELLAHRTTGQSGRAATLEAGTGAGTMTALDAVVHATLASGPATAPDAPLPTVPGPRQPATFGSGSAAELTTGSPTGQMWAVADQPNPLHAEESWLTPTRPTPDSGTNSLAESGQFGVPLPTTDTGQFAAVTGTRLFAVPATVATGQFAAPAAVIDTGQFSVLAPVSSSAPGTAPVPAPVPVIPVPEPAYGGKAAKALEFARAQIGRPCLLGATGPESYDCSSLTQAAWRAADVSLPRTAIDQARSTATVPLTDLQPGDLIFFHADVSHVGLYTGNGTMIHAPGPGAAVREESIFFAGQTAIYSAARPA